MRGTTCGFPAHRQSPGSVADRGGAGWLSQPGFHKWLQHLSVRALLTSCCHAISCPPSLSHFLLMCFLASLCLAEAIVCSHCFRFIGPLEKQVGQQILEAVDEARRCNLDEASPVDDSSASEAGRHQEVLMMLQGDALKLLDGRLALPHTDAVPLPAAVSCWFALRTVGLCCSLSPCGPWLALPGLPPGTTAGTFGWLADKQQDASPAVSCPALTSPAVPCPALTSPQSPCPAAPFHAAALFL